MTELYLNNFKNLSLDELKKLTIEAKDLSGPFNYFFDMTERPGFIENQRTISRTANHPLLLLVVMAVENSLNTLVKDIKIRDRFFFEVPEHHFLHGTLQLQDNPALIATFYFSDIQIGLVGHVDTSFKTNLFRFSLAEQQLPHQVH